MTESSSWTTHGRARSNDCKHAYVANATFSITTAAFIVSDHPRGHTRVLRRWLLPEYRAESMRNAQKSASPLECPHNMERCSRGRDASSRPPRSRASGLGHCLSDLYFSTSKIFGGMTRFMRVAGRIARRDSMSRRVVPSTKEAALKLETLQVESTSQKWRQIVVILLCMACALMARIVIHWSSTQLSKVLQPTAPESVPSVQVEKSAPGAPGAPGRRF